MGRRGVGGGVGIGECVVVTLLVAVWISCMLSDQPFE